MGRTVVVDETGVEAHTQQRLFAADPEDCFVIGLIPTPLPEVEPTAGKKKKLSPVDVLDAEWMSEHAHQVNRMLPGGLAIVGAYLFAGADASAALLPKMHLLLHSIREAAGYRGKQGGPSELLLLQIASDTKKYTAKSIDITNKKGDTKPVDLVFQSIASSFQCFTCSVDVSLAITLSPGQSPREQIEAALEREAEALRKGVVLVNRTVVDEDAPICGNKKSGGKGDAKGKKKAKPGNLPAYAVHAVDIFTEGLPSSLTGASPSKDALGTFTFSGSILGRAYCHPKNSYGAAIAALKADIGKSLAARFDFLCEELERRESDLKERKKKASSDELFNPFGESKQGPKFEQRWGLPQRVFFPFVKPLLVADYLMPFETVREDCCERAKALLDLQPSEQDFVTPERFASDDLEAELSSTTTPTRGAAAKKAKTTQETKTKAKAKKPTEETEDDEEEAEEDIKGALSPRLLAHAEPEPGGGTVARREERSSSSSAVVIGLALAALIALLAIASLGVLG
ncbi:uncharacterized protein ACA1_054440 [Acanthamoeba castellanii str. Neff]|uniref:Uncharacterized protein n=1 Tax=Acanthamoeba castellanii (strain ATCC 30010 / Neff) TaxID=1257118 RepID=L8H7J7_ACACF|nr:uncharacterized protein ACA1_054440 [Acanthamoeba castellanii str. Neff]ELR20698.1 hypothetical protein ACA1_054440 [Acanthamoeba castellanii str. Neff]